VSATASATVGSGARFVALVRYTLRACLPPRRLIGLLLPCAGALMFGLLTYAVDTTRDRAFANIAAEGIFSLALPVEMRSGTFHFTWLSPTPVWQIVLARWMAGSGVALVTITPACALAAVVAGSSSSAVSALIAAAVGSVAYVALFVAIGCLTKRTAVWSLAFVFFVERLLGAALTGIAQLSPTWLSRSIFVGLLDNPPSRLVRDGIPSGTGAIVRLAIITAVCLAVASWRLRSVKLAVGD
jgi:hypothetical protein